VVTGAVSLQVPDGCEPGTIVARDRVSGTRGRDIGFIYLFKKQSSGTAYLPGGIAVRW